ncbi:hypothetical protein SNOG_07226 [Parastagonospora nodorum SN15]|uniref:Uncharacterized protein n=1 Tax=Phaeosphaeria nodorum (strain SN15 / ATCC MYA-4574 / FGSC 10173) TaxID=321614 RepID=Q0ULY8_PHANO|nr:hypothetical protein SNOG_07226 [Parastagonospora nodorum SN15]EAT85877.1 hypothetical protein SNOG_07226 [Parastagonospora nodorum SN15]
MSSGREWTCDNLSAAHFLESSAPKHKIDRRRPHSAALDGFSYSARQAIGWEYSYLRLALLGKLHPGANCPSGTAAIPLLGP